MKRWCIQSWLRDREVSLFLTRNLKERRSLRSLCAAGSAKAMRKRIIYIYIKARSCEEEPEEEEEKPARNNHQDVTLST